MKNLHNLHNKHKVFVISGPSGAGKNSIVQSLLKVDSFCLYYSVSCTSRKIREGEVDGKDYYFLSHKEFEKKIKEDLFIEFTEYLGNYYGTLKSEVLDNINNKNILLEIEYKGLENIQNVLNNISVISIGILPIKDEQNIKLLSKTISKRLKKRNLDPLETINKRINYILDEEIKKYNKTLYNYIVYNKDDRLEETINRVKQIIKNNL